MARLGKARLLAVVVVAAVLLGVALSVWALARDDDGGAAAPADVSEPSLHNPHTCSAVKAFTCATLRVPLDHAAPGGRSLGLQVATADNGDAPRGVLLLLTGGPGQPGVGLLPRILRPFAGLRDDYRIVVIDQRGTGGTALRCPGLQKQLGASDLFVPSRAAVVGCARSVGPDRRFFGSADTVADLELLRRALGVRQLTLDGVSYGTFVAEHYAIAYPSRVARMVLDSVVPHAAIEPFLTVPLAATARVLRDLCTERSCPGDPAADLHAAVSRRDDGSDVLNAITIDEFVSTRYAGVPELLHAAAAGDMTGLDALIAGVRRGVQIPAEQLSQGLHAATLCADAAWPWGRSTATAAERVAAVRDQGARLSADDVFPYDVATATGNGILRTCQWWPPGPVTPLARPRTLPPVPTLLLGGGHDLSTPLEWLRQEEAVTPDATVVVIPDATHGLQNRSNDPRVMKAVTRFLTPG